MGMAARMSVWLLQLRACPLLSTLALPLCPADPLPSFIRGQGASHEALRSPCQAAEACKKGEVAQPTCTLLQCASCLTLCWARPQLMSSFVKRSIVSAFAQTEAAVEQAWHTHTHPLPTQSHRSAKQSVSLLNAGGSQAQLGGRLLCCCCIFGSQPLVLGQSWRL